MKTLKISLMVLAMVVSLTLSTFGMAEARSGNNSKNNNKQYSQSYKNNRNYKAKRSVNHCTQYKKIQRVKYVKPQRSYKNHNNRYLYPALLGAGVGMLVLGIIR